MGYGYNGKILRVDLSAGEVLVEEYDDSFLRTYVGGRGFIIYHLMNEVVPEIDALDPQNRLVFAAGPLTGAPLPGSGRNSVGAKSPLTGGYGEAEAGGFFGAEMRHAGYDGLVIEGKAESPVYLWIHDGNAEIRDARHLWGLSTLESQSRIQRELGDKLIRTAQIGPAGEHQVRYACIINDLRHAAGRCGLGAVMGSKNLKAVAARGHGGPLWADIGTIRKWARWMVEHYREYVGQLQDVGSAGLVRMLNNLGGLPTRNFQEGVFEGAELISGQTMKETILVGRESCYACPINCKRVVKLETPYQVDPLYGGPEYETVASLGSLCGVSDLKAIAKGHELCNSHGLDTISTGTTIAFAMECREKGLLTIEDTDGLDLRFGNAEAMLRMVERIAYREGFGDTLADGVRRAAEQIGGGAEQYAMHVKGQECPMHEPRIKHGLGLGYSLSPTGASHGPNIHDTTMDDEGPLMEKVRALGVLHPLTFDDLGTDKVRYYTYSINWGSLGNCLGLCEIPPYDYSAVVELVNAATGWKTNMWELMKAGERMNTLCRLYNARQGIVAEEDSLPDRFFKAFTDSLPTAAAMDKTKWEEAKKLYYAIMGWDNKGIPTSDKLVELGVGWAVGEFQNTD